MHQSIHVPEHDGYVHNNSIIRRRLAPITLVLGAAFILMMTISPGCAAGYVAETWANDTIDSMTRERTAASGKHRRRRTSAVERIEVWDDDDEVRPQRRAHRARHDTRYETRSSTRRSHARRRGARMASLGRTFAAPAPSALADARPRSRAKRKRSPGSMLSSLGRDLVTPSASLSEGLQQRRRTLRRAPGPMVASLGRDFIAPSPSTAPNLIDESVRWVASAECLAGVLRDVIMEVASLFGPVRVNSTCRSRRHNARVGGARRSYHLTGNAADFRMESNVKAVYAYLRSNKAVGGLKHYGRGVFHIDTGPRRTW